MSQKKIKKLLFAVGGTGGHLFPAQSLAKDLKETNEPLEILFGGKGLGKNPFFQKLPFPFREISSSTPFRNNPFHAVFGISKGMIQSFQLFKEYTPDLIIGFGSFYSFPLLAAARMKKIPFLLVESDAFPGKVNRFFSSKARVSVVQFQEAAKSLKGNTLFAKIPSKEKRQTILSSSEAKKYFHLDPKCFTLLAFGGSQGSREINQAVVGLDLPFSFQVLHFCGRGEDPSFFAQQYKKRGIRAYVKSFEEQIDLAWKAADLAICRAGAATLAELRAFQTPAILIPWPGASGKHQHKNARIMEKLGGVFFLDQTQIQELSQIILQAKDNLEKMRVQLNSANHQLKESLHQIVLNQLKDLE